MCIFVQWLVCFKRRPTLAKQTVWKRSMEQTGQLLFHSASIQTYPSPDTAPFLCLSAAYCHILLLQPLPATTCFTTTMTYMTSVKCSSAVTPCYCCTICQLWITELNCMHIAKYWSTVLALWALTQTSRRVALGIVGYLDDSACWELCDRLFSSVKQEFGQFLHVFLPFIVSQEKQFLCQSIIFL